MWWYRGLATLLLVAGLVACSGEEPESEKVVPVAGERVEQATGQGSAGQVGERDEKRAGTGAARDRAHGGTPVSGEEDQTAESDIQLPAELDLTLPRELDMLDGEPLQAQPGRLPDLFEVGPSRRRASVSGELIIGDTEEEKAFDLQRVQGGKIDVEISLD